MLKYTIVDLPGNASVKVAALEVDQKNNAHPTWMVSIQNFCHSTIKGFENYTRLLGWQGDCGREEKEKDDFHQSSLDHSLITLIVPASLGLTELETALYKGAKVDPVSIIKLGTIGYNTVKLQDMSFTGCFISHLQQEFDRVIIRISVCEKTNTLFQYDQHGHALGQTVSRINFITNANV